MQSRGQRPGEMGERLHAAVAVLVALGTVGALPAGGLAADATPAAEQTDEETLAPGERLAGVVGVQRADIEGEMETRAFGERVAAAPTNESKAGVVDAELDRLDERLADLEAEQRAVRESYENGTIDEGEYRARMARLHAEAQAVQRQANATERAARGLPAAALEAKGVDRAAIRSLRAAAGNLTGPETAAIAREIAGPMVGQGVGQRGPPGFVSNRTGGPGAPNQTGPPGDAGPGNDSRQAGGAGERGPPNSTGPANETSPAGQQGPANGTGPASQPEPANQTAPAEQAPNGDGPANETGGGGSA